MARASGIQKNKNTLPLARDMQAAGANGARPRSPPTSSMERPSLPATCFAAGSKRPEFPRRLAGRLWARTWSRLPRAPIFHASPFQKTRIGLAGARGMAALPGIGGAWRVGWPLMFLLSPAGYRAKREAGRSPLVTLSPPAGYCAKRRAGQSPLVSLLPPAGYRAKRRAGQSPLMFLSPLAGYRAKRGAFLRRFVSLILYAPLLLSRQRRA